MVRRVDSRLLVLSRLALCRFGLTVVISNILVVLIRMQTSFAVVVSGFGLNVKQQTNKGRRGTVGSASDS